MYIVKVLKRKDAASVVLAVVLAILLLSPLQVIPAQWVDKLLDGNKYQTVGRWEDIYLYPILTLIIQLVLIELGLRLAIFVRGSLVRRK